jgi:stage II sporulation protein D
MRADWPMEALKAQAILARTFTLKFISEKESQYKGADISTDIKEAQAYDEAKINDRIIKAVDETKGLVLSSDGKFPYAWFHAHAGGQTELATKALDFEGQEPPYTESVQSPDSDRAPDSVKHWTATFTADEVGAAADKAGTKTGAVKTIEIGEKGESGRAVTFKINGQDVKGPALRIALDPMKLKSTLISEVSVSGGKVSFTGSGYGHGVGMSQWGAYGMAEQGSKAEDIVMHYFKNVSVVKLWD